MPEPSKFLFSLDPRIFACLLERCDWCNRLFLETDLKQVIFNNCLDGKPERYHLELFCTECLKETGVTPL